MTANIQKAGTDLDTLFAAHVTNNAANATGYQVGGVDIQTRYDPLAAPADPGRGTRIPATGITTSATGWSANTDLASIFCGNSALYSLTAPVIATHVGFTSPITMTHTVTVTFASAAALTSYFFYGGRLRLTCTQTGGSTTADADLAAMFTAMGTIVIYDQGHFQTAGSTGGTVTNATTGGSNIGTTTVALYNTSDASPYTSSTYTVSLRANAAAGSATVLTLTTVLTLPTAGTIADTYTGTYTSQIQQRNYSTQTVPTFGSTGP